MKPRLLPALIHLPLLLFCASCSTTQPPQPSAFEQVLAAAPTEGQRPVHTTHHTAQPEPSQDPAEGQRLSGILGERFGAYAVAVMQAAEAFEPSGATPADIAVAAHQKCLGEFKAYKEAAADVYRWTAKQQGVSSAQVEKELPGMYKKLDATRKHGENAVIRRVVEIRADPDKVEMERVIKRADDTLEKYLDAIMRASVPLEPSGDPPAEIAAVCLVKSQPELDAARRADADLFAWTDKRNPADAWTKRMRENESFFIDAGTNAVIQWITGVRSQPANQVPAPAFTPSP